MWRRALLRNPIRGHLDSFMASTAGRSSRPHSSARLGKGFACLMACMSRVHRVVIAGCLVAWTSPTSLFSVTLETKAQEFNWRLVCQGELPQEISGGSVRVGDLLGQGLDYLVVRDNNTLRIFQYADGEWTQVHQIAFAPSPAPSGGWTIGNLDSRGGDEILVASGRTLRWYAWDGRKWDSSTCTYASTVWDMVIGDIEDDGKNELVMLCADRGTSPEGFGQTYHVCLARYEKGKVPVFWTDSGHLGYYRSEAIPPDTLLCIADLFNLGHNQLLLARGQSDVSETEYHALIWKEGQLKLFKTFWLQDSAITQLRRPKCNSFLLGEVTPVVLEGETLLLGSMVGNEPFHFFEVLLKIEKDQISVMQPLFRHEGWQLPNPAYWADIDGKGKGVLRIIALRNGRKMFTFHRP